MADFQRPLLSATDEGQTQYAKKQIPSFGDLKEQYNQKWAKEKDGLGVDLVVDASKGNLNINKVNLLYFLLSLVFEKYY